MSCPPCTNTCNQGRTCPHVPSSLAGADDSDDKPEVDGLPWGGLLVAVPALVMVAIVVAVVRGCPA
jgi:hypothetical protein